MTHYDFSVRSARDEMRRVVGRSAPDVIIGSAKDQNGACKKKNKDHVEFQSEWYEVQMARGRYIVSELTSEANTRMNWIAADLCVFGLTGCDDGGAGFVNVGSRAVTNARQVGMRMQRKCASTHQHVRVDARSTSRETEETGARVHHVAQAKEQ